MRISTVYKSDCSPILARKFSEYICIFGISVGGSAHARLLTRPPCFAQDADPMELTRQLTLIEAAIYRKVQAKETMGLSWNVKERQHLAANILDMVNRCNDVCMAALVAIC